MCLPTDEEELEMSQRLIGAGARCGITKKVCSRLPIFDLKFIDERPLLMRLCVCARAVQCDEPYVDGMPIAESIRVIHDIIKAGLQ